MNIYIVIPVFNEEENLPSLFTRLKAVFKEHTSFDFKVLYVNDNSTDTSFEIISQQHKTDSRFCALNLSRNFGHQAAISAGLHYADDADAVIIMDGDLQDPPEVIPLLLETWQSGGQVVLAQRSSRKDSLLRKILFRLFYLVFRIVSDFPIPSDIGVFGLLDKSAVKSLCIMPEKNRFLPGMRSWIGFEQRIVLYNREARAAGKPKQSLKRLFRYALNGIFSFSYKPLRVLMVSGLCISTCGFLLGSYYITKRLLGIEMAQMGFTTLVTLILFLGGAQLIGMGVLGEYLGRVYDEVKQRPLFIVNKKIGIEENS